MAIENINWVSMHVHTKTARNEGDLMAGHYYIQRQLRGPSSGFYYYGKPLIIVGCINDFEYKRSGRHIAGRDNMRANAVSFETRFGRQSKGE